jgi:hypothetical protein
MAINVADELDVSDVDEGGGVGEAGIAGGVRVGARVVLDDVVAEVDESDLVVVLVGAGEELDSVGATVLVVGIGGDEGEAVHDQAL